MLKFYKLWSKLLMISSLTLMIFGLLLMKKEWSILIQFNFIQMSSCKMEMFIIMDWISMFFSSAVLFISSMVIMFSEEYMESDIFKYRFLMMVLLFVLSMFLLILSPNMMSILLGWDGLGLVSYCLVIYYQNPRSYNAGMLTVLSNRIGDVLILTSIALMISMGSWDIMILNKFFLPTLMSMLILLAAMTKSAQIPFSAWLPAAMAAPTPVSALVHSSTLVTAGVFLLIRFHNIFLNNLTSSMLLLSSCLTMFMAGVGATLETDLKKIIALSTLSQLGVMMMALSLNLWTLAYFHMITHAMFKSLLFLCAGYIIHNTKNNQDIRKMGMLIFPSPLISTAMLISSLALMGFPFLAGFYSSDLILEQSMKSNFFLFSMILTLISFGMTMAYSIRLPYLSMISKTKSLKSILIEETSMMKTSIFSLAVMAIITGALLSWIILPSPKTILIPTLFKILGFLLIIIGIMFSSILWIMNSNLLTKKMLKKSFLGSMWFLPLMSTLIFTKILTKFSMLKSSELGWSEMMGAQGMYNNIKINSNKLSKIQNNHIQLFLLSFIIMISTLMYFYSQ